MDAINFARFPEGNVVTTGKRETPCHAPGKTDEQIQRETLESWDIIQAGEAVS